MAERAIPPARPWYELIVKTIALRGWSKTTLSERSGISRSTIDNWQRNPRKPQASAVNAVADSLGIPREKAHELAGVLPVERGPGSTVPDEVLAVIRKNYTPEKQREVIEMLEQLSGPPGTEPSEASDPGSERAG
jgi:transcriptional regulator with XRE-family HTH domain